MHPYRSQLDGGDWLQRPARHRCVDVSGDNQQCRPSATEELDKELESLRGFYKRLRWLMVLGISASFASSVGVAWAFIHTFYNGNHVHVVDAFPSEPLPRPPSLEARAPEPVPVNPPPRPTPPPRPNPPPADPPSPVQVHGPVIAPEHNPANLLDQAILLAAAGSELTVQPLHLSPQDAKNFTHGPSLQSRVHPVEYGKGIMGVKILKLSNPWCGVQQGDIILSINGYPLRDPNVALQAYAEAMSIRHALFLIVRQNKPVLLSVTWDEMA